MRIDQLSATNFKNFTALEVEFSSGVNLFVGSNGSGKTSILEAINVAIGCFFSYQEAKLQRGIDFDEIKITHGKREASATISASSLEPMMKWSRTIKSSTKANDSKSAHELGEYGKIFFEAFESDDGELVVPLIAYYSTQRLFKATMSSKQRFDPAAGRRNGYLQSLKGGAIKGLLNDWLSNAVTLRGNLQFNNIPVRDFALENVESAIKYTLKEFNPSLEENEIKLYPNPYYDNELFVYLDELHDLPISYYSDGFRNLIYLVFDMVWRASILNPSMRLEEISQKVIGVVTIDEIDLHLHPKWQAKAIGLLQYLFPQVQFFITTHSPSVVANFDNGTLYVISDDTINRQTGKYFGKQVNTILRDILGANDRHIPTQMKLDELLRLIDEDKKEAYTVLLAELEQQLGQEDAELQRAFALIAMKEYTENDQDAVH